MSKVTRASIQAFLSAQRIAVIGVSRNPKEYSRALFRTLREHGYEAIPVHPSAETLDGQRCFRSVKEIQPAPERAVILLPEAQTEKVVLECHEAGVRHLWLHRRIGTGVVDTRAIACAEERGLELITGLCLFMFLPRSGVIHRLHGGIMRFLGNYPE